MLFFYLSVLCLLPASAATVVCSAERRRNHGSKGCGYRGSLRRTNIVTPSNITVTPPSTDGPDTPFRNCLRTCLVNTNCHAWSFDFGASSGDTACVIYGSPLKQMRPGPTDPSSTKIFYNKNCTTATFADGYVNTDFETGDLTGWFPEISSSRGNISVIPGTSYSRAGYVAKLQAGGFPGRGIQASNAVEMHQFSATLCNGVNYTLAFDYYIPSDGQAGADPGACEFILKLESESEIYDTEKFMRFRDLPDGTWDSWQHVQAGTFPGTDERNTLSVYLFTGPSSFNTILLDNVVLEPVN